MPKPHRKKPTISSKSKVHVKHTVKKASVSVRHTSKHVSQKHGGKQDKKGFSHIGHVASKNIRKHAEILPKIVVKETLKERREKEAEVAFNEHRKQDIKVVEEVFADPNFAEQFTTSMGEKSVDVVKALYKKPQTDEKLTEKLDMKINEVRRLLNMMNSHSITKYDVTKDSSGWLIFTWRVDAEKLSEYVNVNKQKVALSEPGLPENCNDFFMCKKCYENNKTILPFDSAIEHSFKCLDCGRKLEMVDRQDAEIFVKGLKTKETS